jgi:high-affinity iron transporter
LKAGEESKVQNLFSSLVITLREGIEGALALAIVLLYLRKTGKTGLSSAVWTGLAAAVVASIAGSFFLERISISSEILEGILMLVAAMFVGSMILWMWKSARGLKKEIENKIEEITAAPSEEGKGVWLGLFFFTFLLIVREGIETVIFLRAVSLNTNELLSFLGGIAGLILAVLFGIFFVRGSLRIDLGRFFKITGIVLLLFVVQLTIGAVHELGEAGLFNIGTRWMSIIGPIVKNNALFIIGILLIPVLLLLIPGRKAIAATEANTTRAEQRLLLARERRQKIWRLGAAIISVCIVLFIAYDFVYSQNRTLSTPVEVSAPNGEIRIPLGDLADGKLHRFILRGSHVRFIVLRTEQGKVVSAFDACEICGSQGYVQESGKLICLNCSADINTATLGQTGGCNPIVLSSRIEANQFVVRAEDLKREESRFQSVQHSHH